MRKSNAGVLAGLPLLGLLSACGAGEPADAAHVENLMRQDSVEDGYEVSWVYADPEEEAGHFRTYVDRSKPDEEGSDETWMCNVQATTMSNSWTCQTMEPSLITQAVNMIEGQYGDRNLELADYSIRRTGEGFDFAGHVVVREPISGERAQVPCTGSQDGTRFEINCDQNGAQMLPPEGAPTKG